LKRLSGVVDMTVRQGIRLYCGRGRVYALQYKEEIKSVGGHAKVVLVDCLVIA